MKSISKKQVFIVDDHPAICFGLSCYLNNEKNFFVCGDASDANTAIKMINSLSPDVVIIDISLNGSTGLDLTAAIKSRYKIPVLIFSMHDEKLYAERAIKAGARGYLMKSETMERMVFALNRILEGKMFLSKELEEMLLEKLLMSKRENTQSPLYSLTNRELDVFHLIGNGMNNRNIARKLSLSVKTVETYRERIKKKLNITHSSELIKFAIHSTSM